MGEKVIASKYLLISETTAYLIDTDEFFYSVICDVIHRETVNVYKNKYKKRDECVIMPIVVFPAMRLF